MESFLINAPALWFLALTGVILLFYLLRLKRRRHEVSSIILFSRAVEEVQANAPIQWLKRNLLLLLQLLVLIFLVLALARPFMSTSARKSGKTVVVIDTSYSMLARDGGKTRLELAVDEAHRILSGLRLSDTAMVIAMSSSPTVVNGFTPDRMELNRSLNRIEDYLGGAANLNECMKLLNPLLKDGARVVLISDGGFKGDVNESIPEEGVFEFVSVGTRIDNVGITSLSVTEIPGTKDCELFAVLSNSSDKPVKRTVRLSTRNLLIDQRQVDVPPNGGIDVVISPLTRYTSVLTLEVSERDGFATDDRCEIVIPEERVIPVNFVSEPDVLFESALAGDESLDVVRIPPGTQSGGMTGRNGVFIFNKCKPPNGTTLPMLVVCPSDRVGGVTPEGTTETARVVDWDAAHPLLAYIRVADLRIAEAVKARLSPDMKTVIEGTDGALLAVGEDSYTRYAVLLFDVAKSDFPLRAAFPIFLHNTVVWLSRSASGFDPYNTAVGRPWRCKVPDGTERVKLKSPSGRELTLAARGNEVGGVSLDETGVWYMTAPNLSKTLSVNLLDAEESRLAVRDSFKIGAEEVKSNERNVSNRELYPWIVFVVLVVIMGEWFVYHQRNV